MSDATVEVLLAEGTHAGYSIYQGSADLIYPRLYETQDEAWDHRKTAGNWDHECDDPHPVDAWAYSHYGGGFHWPVKVCHRCGFVLDRLSPYGEDWGWSPMPPEVRAAEKAWLQAGWPHDGKPPVADPEEQ
jgi:hypothetical protein